MGNERWNSRDVGMVHPNVFPLFRAAVAEVVKGFLQQHSEGTIEPWARMTGRAKRPTSFDWAILIERLAIVCVREGRSKFVFTVRDQATGEELRKELSTRTDVVEYFEGPSIKGEISVIDD